MIGLKSFFSNSKYTRNNLILKEILEIAYTSQIVEEAGIKIISVLNRYYDFDYCTLYKYDEKRDTLNIIASNIKWNDAKDMRDLINIANTLLNNNKYASDAYIESSNYPLKYASTSKRNVKYLYFIPLKTNNNIIGALLIERTNDTNSSKELETEFFKVITETITLALQNLIYFEKITNSAYLDGLTEIYNRKYLEIFKTKKIQVYIENKIPFAIVMFDIDHFKKFNDTYGHHYGDLVLKQVSQLVSKHIRETDTIFRYGGEEFLIFMPDIDKSTAFKRIDTIREKISDLILIDENGVSATVTCSFGISAYPEDDTIIEILIEKADKALYYSKNTGRNKTTTYSKELDI